MRLRTAIPIGLTLLLAAGNTLAAAASKPAAKSARSSSVAGSKSRGKKSSRHSKARERGQKAPAPERISEIQQALVKEGSFNGAPSGKWDDSTVVAMKKFQESHGLNPSGRLDALTLERLGLGSPTAGKGAPLPALNPSSSKLVAPTQTAKRE
jgi:peptidoglycan hydrolase-like protein with peptidoglycan-binding domain